MPSGVESRLADVLCSWAQMVCNCYRLPLAELWNGTLPNEWRGSSVFLWHGGSRSSRVASADTECRTLVTRAGSPEAGRTLNALHFISGLRGAAAYDLVFKVQ